MVPLVIGARNVSRVAPPGSYIHVMDYSSPKELADYIRLLDRNDTLYKTFFNWKENYRVTVRNHYKDLFCQLCQFLYSNAEKKTMVIDHFDDWFFHKSNCEGDIFKLLAQKGNQRRFGSYEVDTWMSEELNY